MKIIFQIDGGIGKSIMATAVCKAIKRQYPQDQLFVITGYPEVFLCNPNVDRVFNFNNLNYFYEDHIAGQKVRTFLHNPYSDSAFINMEGHLIEVWCRMFGVTYNGEYPELYINQREREHYAAHFGSQKPIMLIQTNGGAPSQASKYSWTRDLPLGTAQQVVDAFAQQFNVVHIRRNDQPALQNTTPLQADFRAVATLITLSSKRLFIDSFCQHTAAALGMPSVVCWVGNTPSQFGYDLHTNIIAADPPNKPELRHSVFSRYNITGQPTEFPYNHESEIFNAKQIIQLLSQQPDARYGGSHTFTIADRIRHDAKNRSMVANRLLHLIDKVDLTDVKHILDIGSRDLWQSVEFANIFQNARIDAFEPVPGSYNDCLATMEKIPEDFKKRIRVHKVALCDTDGEIPFYPVVPELSSTPNVGASSMMRFMEGLNGTPFNQELVQEEITVIGTKPDTWAAENGVEQIDIMWMDVQGAELLVLKGAEELLKRTKIIMTEVGLKPYYEGHTLKVEIDSYLAAHGFVELEGAFQLNGFDYEANTIYIRK